MNNIHNQSIPQPILDQAIAKINEAGAILKPFLLTLTSIERSDMLKMGDKSSAFVQKALEYSRTNPEFAPGYLNLGDFDIDFTDSQNLISVLNIVTQLTNGIDDTKMVAGSEAYQAALLYYNGVQKAVDMNAPGAKAIYEELKNRFPVRTKKAVAPAV
jgi:hypothetical protein